MRYWSETDANGNPLTDGRVCLVIQSEENPDMPAIYTYGKDKEEVLEKLAKTTETAQGQIHRMRKAPVAATPARPAAPPVDPAKVNEFKSVARAAGLDVDAEAKRQAAKRIADIGFAWEKNNPGFPKDPRNQRMLIDRAIVLSGGDYYRITAESLDRAFEQLSLEQVFHEPKPAAQAADGGSTVQPGGSPDSRTVREATSYRRNAFSSPEPPKGNEKPTEKEARWRNILENGSGKALDDAIRNEPGFQEWVDKQYAKTA